MNDILPTVAVVLLVIGVMLMFIFFFTRKPGEGKKLKGRDRNFIVREANRKLAQNPKDREALLALADLYYCEEAWEKAMRSYQVLMDLCGSDPMINEFEVTLRYAVSAMKLKNFEEAHKAFLLARTAEPESFEVNYNLGYLEYKLKNHEKAAVLLRHAMAKQPEHVETWKYLGHSLFKLGKAKEALVLLRRVFDNQPEDRESLFVVGQCYSEIGMFDQAVRVFTHLRPDPVLGPQAALMAGLINLKTRQFDKAIMDLEIGLRHKDIPADVLLEMKYRLASAYSSKQEIGKALQLLMDIKSLNPSYKDVESQISRYRELAGNKNLQTFLISPPSDFVTLCRKITTSFIPGAKTKIIDITVQTSDYADILAEVETVKWQDVILFRFIRTSGKVGELTLRDFQARLKEAKAGRGFCFAAGDYTEEAVRFVEARLIDLIDKNKLLKILAAAG